MSVFGFPPVVYKIKKNKADNNDNMEISFYLDNMNVETSLC